MIVKILGKASKGFAGINYNTSKVEQGKGELLKTTNFGALQGLTNLRPQDYINYLQMVSARNKRVEQPQMHVVLSSKGKLYSKEELMDITLGWLAEMGYAKQPTVVVFHKDTANNHIHAVTTRVGSDGKKINSAFEKVRALAALDRVLGYEFALQYKFSTRAQFYLLLETQGYIGKDYNEKKLQRRLDAYRPDLSRIDTLKAILNEHKGKHDLIRLLKNNFNIQILLHASEGKKPYGYTIIDHETLQVFKGSEILGLKHLFSDEQIPTPSMIVVNSGRQVKESPVSTHDPEMASPTPVHIPPISIADDVDDEALLGRNRRSKKKARTNTR